MIRKIIKTLTNILKGNKSITGVSVNNKLFEQNSNTINNIAVQNNNIISGVTYDDAKQIAIDVYRQNFPKLKYYAMQIANQRIKDFIDKYLPQIPENTYYKFIEPDIQYTWNNIAQIAALRNNEELNDILGQLLVDKLNSATDYDSILLSHTIKLVNNISTEELKLLSLYYIVTNKQICKTPSQILSYLLDFDTTRCKEYASSLISNGIAYRSGGFASYIKSEETGYNEEYINKINILFANNTIFVNFVVLNCGEKIADKYLQCLSNKISIL